MENSPKEIDLLTLLVKAYRFTIRNIWVFVIALLLGGSISVYTYYQTSTTYMATATLTINYVNQEVVKVIVENISERIGANGEKAAEFAKLFNLTKSQYQALKDVKFETMYLDDAQEEKAPYFKLTVISEDPRLLDTLLDGVIYYINNHPYITERFQVNLKGLDMKMGRLQVEYRELDSLQLMYTGLIKEGRYVPVVGNNDKSVYSELVSLYTQWVNMYQSRELIEGPVTVIDKELESDTVKSSLFDLLVWPVLFLVIASFVLFILRVHRLAFR